MKIDIIFDTSKMTDPKYLAEWTLNYCKGISQNKHYLPEDQSVTDEMHFIEWVLGDKDVLKNIEPMGWRPYICAARTGYEDMGSDAYVVIAIAKENSVVIDHKEFSMVQDAVHIIRRGYYASYEGTDWNTGWTFAKPYTYTMIGFKD